MDLGCGGGLFAERLISKGYDAYGLDAAPDGICFAELRNPGRFFVCDNVTAPLPDALRGIPIRTVVSMNTLGHIRDPCRLAEVARSLLEAGGGGTLILSVVYHGYLKNLTISLADGWDDRWDPLSAESCTRLWSRYTLTRLLAEAGFRNLRFRGAGRFPGLWRHLVCRAEI